MSETVTVTLTEFLLARIAEDEGTALYAQTRDDIQPEDWGGWWFGHHQHYSRYTPARVIAECEAKRRIVEDFADAEREAERHDPDNPTPAYWQAWGERHGLLGALEALALPYADHEDYREEWKL